MGFVNKFRRKSSTTNNERDQEATEQEITPITSHQHVDFDHMNRLISNTAINDEELIMDNKEPDVKLLAAGTTTITNILDFNTMKFVSTDGGLNNLSKVLLFNAIDEEASKNMSQRDLTKHSVDLNVGDLVLIVDHDFNDYWLRIGIVCNSVISFNNDDFDLVSVHSITVDNETPSHLFTDKVLTAMNEVVSNTLSFSTNHSVKANATVESNRIIGVVKVKDYISNGQIKSSVIPSVQNMIDLSYALLKGKTPNGVKPRHSDSDIQDGGYSDTEEIKLILDAESTNQPALNEPEETSDRPADATEIKHIPQSTAKDTTNKDEEKNSNEKQEEYKDLIVKVEESVSREVQIASRYMSKNLKATNYLSPASLSDPNKAKSDSLALMYFFMNEAAQGGDFKSAMQHIRDVTIISSALEKSTKKNQ